MSMSLLLEGTRDFLRDNMPLTPRECDVQFGGLPPPVAGQFFVSLENAGTASGFDNSYYLKETFSIEISVWRRPGEAQRDRWGEFEFRSNKYLEASKTREKIQRRILELLHQKPGVMVAINGQFALPNETLGDRFTSSFVHRGTSGVLTQLMPESPELAFIGSKMSFTGAMRLQKVDQQK